MDNAVTINKRLKQLGIRNKALREELTDHYLSNKEARILAGYAPKEALDLTLQQMKTDQLKEVNKSIFMIQHKKTLVWSNSLILVLALSTFFVVNSQHKNERYQWPVKINKQDITFPFGKKIVLNKETHVHEGIDIRAKEGTPVHAPLKGEVIETGYGPKRGYYVVLKHSGYISRYFHLSRILVSKGDQIEKNAMIARTGNSGASTGPHLHYEVLKDNQHINPVNISEALTHHQ